MNLRMFPVHSNRSRRLRRTGAVVDFGPVLGARSIPSVTRSPLRLESKSKAELSSPPAALNRSGDSPWQRGNAPAQPSSLLSQSEQEMTLRQQAVDAVKQGALPQAIALYTQLIRLNPESASHFNNRGLVYFQQGQLSLALLDYHRALMLNPRLGKVYNNRANCYAVLGRLSEAIADYETAIDLDPTDTRARLNLGITWRQLQEYDLAIETFDAALQCSQFLNTTDLVPTAAAIEGHLYAERGRTSQLLGDWNYAIADYHRALERLPFAGSTLDAPKRLRTQVKAWLNELLNPLTAEEW